MDEKKITFKYIFDKDYNPKHVNGVNGSITPSGDIVANFFFERQALPNSQTQQISPLGGLGPITETDPADLNETMIRFVETGISMNESFALVLREWLDRQLALLESRKLSEKNKQ